jgi:PAS domain S-box-containing protein
VVLTFRQQTYADGTWELLSTVVDITEVKRAQEETAREHARFRFIFESLPVGVAWMICNDVSTRIVNPSFARITGVPLEHCQDLERYWLATHPDDRPIQDALHLELATNKLDRYSIEKRYIHPDGEVRWTVLTVRYFLDAATGERQEIGTLVDITDRKKAEQELEAIHKQLLETSRRAGMAEVAVNVLHNVGNVLNSVNVSCSLIDSRVRQSRLDGIDRVAELLQAHEANLADFFTADPRARKLPGFLTQLAASLRGDQAAILSELALLSKNINHIKEIILVQQSAAKNIGGVREAFSLEALIEDALRIDGEGLSRAKVEVVRRFVPMPPVTAEKHKVLQILVNLIRNARQSLAESAKEPRRLTVWTRVEDASAYVIIEDNGMGIAEENLSRIFAHGFTTRHDGYGFGLHSGALAAEDLGGSLTVHSDGVGRGAAFTLKLPIEA